MIAALAVLAAIALLAQVALIYLNRILGRERAAFAAERAQLIRAVIAKHAAEAVGLEMAAGRTPREPRRQDEDAPPPGTQPIGLDGGSR